MLLLAFGNWLCAIPGRQAVGISLPLSRVHAILVNDTVSSENHIDILHALCANPGAIGAWIPAGEVAFDLEPELEMTGNLTGKSQQTFFLWHIIHALSISAGFIHV